ncbi:hypothetical protein GCM10027275_37270 [Rhabdobacter roseus]|uniref:Lipoprotein n=1 Tax=Rhabdobacter roseus TaxID=1655419 RepID=A0A840TSK2_9BACT|nr:hypothetical protein [Rhabdobacter roseus]MBB5285865.1 hypothetical protein [Rhabdobacter roseus]
MKRSLFFALIFLCSCQASRQTVTSLQVTSLKALDLEENLTDELLMAYSLTSFDGSGRAVETVNGSWGIQETKKNQAFDEKAFVPIEIPLPKDGKVVASLVLVEIDDYEKARRTLNELRKYHDIIKVPAGLAELADVALTPLKYLSLGLSAAGVGFQLADRLDNDDVLGQHSTELSYQQALASPQRPVPVTFKGTHLANTFHYELTYDLRSRTILMKPKR